MVSRRTKVYFHSIWRFRSQRRDGYVYVYIYICNIFGAAYRILGRTTTNSNNHEQAAIVLFRSELGPPVFFSVALPFRRPSHGENIQLKHQLFITFQCLFFLVGISNDMLTWIWKFLKVETSFGWFQIINMTEFVSGVMVVCLENIGRFFSWQSYKIRKLFESCLWDVIRQPTRCTPQTKN